MTIQKKRPRRSSTKKRSLIIAGIIAATSVVVNEGLPLIVQLLKSRVR